jgi:hypothetical protein
MTRYLVCCINRECVDAKTLTQTRHEFYRALKRLLKHRLNKCSVWLRTMGTSYYRDTPSVFVTLDFEVLFQPFSRSIYCDEQGYIDVVATANILYFDCLRRLARASSA